MNFSTTRVRRRGGQASALALVMGLAVLLGGKAALAQSCPDNSFCYYAPPILETPLVSNANYTGDLVLASPGGTITGTYSVNGGADVPFSVAPGMPVFIELMGDQGKMSGFLVPEQRGVFIVANSSSLLVDQRITASNWMSSSTVKNNVVGLGTRFRVGGFSLNQDNVSVLGMTDGTGYDFIAFFAPEAASITVTAPPGATLPFWNDGIADLTHSFSLQAGQTYVMRTRTGAEMDGALITSDKPISAAMGGRGWFGTSCGEDAMDHLVPTELLGTQYVVDDYSATAGERVSVIADADGTDVFINGMIAATLNEGETYNPTVTTLTFIETSKPATVFQSTGRQSCALDVALIPPVYFAPLASANVNFNLIGGALISIILPTTAANTVKLNNVAVTPIAIDPVPTRPEYSRVRISVSAGTRTISADSDFQVGMASSIASSTGLFAYHGPYRVPGCGDNSISGSETCDDGNFNDGDGCSATCKVEPFFACNGAPSMCIPLDTDNDGVPDKTDNCDTKPNPNQTDTDMDGIGDACEVDTDMDGVPDENDNCVNTPNTNQNDADMDGIGDACEVDTDMDGVVDDNDNCVNTPNTNQNDADKDGIGDACEVDTDMDGVVDDTDNCVNVANQAQEDADKDGIGDACEPDTDTDGVIDDFDNCDMVANPDQADPDADGIGTSCDSDLDNDGVENEKDNCPNDPNADQADYDNNGSGDACDPKPTDCPPPPPPVSESGCSQSGVTPDVPGVGPVVLMGLVALGIRRRREPRQAAKPLQVKRLTASKG